MPEQPSLPLRVVDARELGEEFRTALRPGQTMADRNGRARRLPRFFYEIPSWEVALKTQLTPHFGIWELIDVDVRETEIMRMIPATCRAPSRCSPPTWRSSARRSAG